MDFKKEDFIQIRTFEDKVVLGLRPDFFLEEEIAIPEPTKREEPKPEIIEPIIEEKKEEIKKIVEKELPDENDQQTLQDKIKELQGLIDQLPKKEE